MSKFIFKTLDILMVSLTFLGIYNLEDTYNKILCLICYLTFKLMLIFIIKLLEDKNG